MTYEETKECFKKMLRVPFKAPFAMPTENFNEALKLSIDALEKQIPKKLKAEGTMVAIDIYGNETHMLSCPNCGRDYEVPKGQATPYCCWCGQAIDWESEETE